jgi:peptide/nickel transport system substrate-binding protein
MDRIGGRIAISRNVLAAVALVAALGALAGCGGSGSGPASASGGGSEAERRLALDIPVQADALDPTKASVGSLGVLLLGLEPLVSYDAETGKVKPDLAEEITKDGPLVYQYKLRQGVKFWDGKPLTPEDVLFSYGLHRGKGTESFIAQQWAPVKSIQAKGEEITITLSEPDPQFPYTVAETGIVEKAYYEAHRQNIGSPGVLNMGTGPYRFKSFVPSSETVLVRNESYWGQKPPYKELDLRTISNEAQLLLAANSGELDGVVAVPLAQVGTFGTVPNLNLTSSPEYSVYKFNFDLKKKPWGDEHLRRAFAYAINRKEIAEGLFKGNAESAVTLVPPSILEEITPKAQVEAGYKRIAGLVPEYDIEAAKRELAASSESNGLETTVLTMGADPNLAQIAQVAAQGLEEVGIKLNIKQVDENTYYNSVYFKHTTDGVSLENFGSSGPDPSNIPDEALNSANAYPQGSGVNVSDYENPQVDELLAKANHLPTTDPRRGVLLMEAEELAAKDTPYVPLVYPDVFLGLRSGLEWKGFGGFWWLSRWPYEITAG